MAADVTRLWQNPGFACLRQLLAVSVFQPLRKQAFDGPEAKNTFSEV